MAAQDQEPSRLISPPHSSATVVRVRDQHPNKAHEGLELVLAKLELKRESSDRYPEDYVIGLMKRVERQVGLFCPETQPLQVLDYYYDEWYFTTGTLGIIHTVDVTDILFQGKTAIRWGRSGTAHISLITGSGLSHCGYCQHRYVYGDTSYDGWSRCPSCGGL